MIPDELPGHILRGEFGKGINILYLWFPCCALATMMSIISLPNLKELSIGNAGITSEEPLPTHPVTPQRGPLDLLQLHGQVGGVGETLAKSRFISRHLSLDVHIPSIEQLIILFSEAVVELTLHGA
jgi:hypothetical protein